MFKFVMYEEVNIFDKKIIFLFFVGFKKMFLKI